MLCVRDSLEHGGSFTLGDGAVEVGGHGALLIRRQREAHHDGLAGAEPNQRPDLVSFLGLLPAVVVGVCAKWERGWGSECR